MTLLRTTSELSDVALAVLVVALFLAFVRLVRGPSVPDRVVALELVTTLVVGTVAVYAIDSDQLIFLDVAIVIALLAFLSTIAFAYFLEKGQR